MTTYAMIDIHSGYVWGVQDAEDVVTACRLMDENVGVYGRTYDEHGPRSSAERNGRSGYVVFDAPAGFDVDDGQSSAEIEKVEALERVAIVLTADASDESYR